MFADARRCSEQSGLTLFYNSLNVYLHCMLRLEQPGGHVEAAVHKAHVKSCVQEPGSLSNTAAFDAGYFAAKRRREACMSAHGWKRNAPLYCP